MSHIPDLDKLTAEPRDLEDQLNELGNTIADRMEELAALEAENKTLREALEGLIGRHADQDEYEFALEKARIALGQAP